jgi:transcriptional regulator with XRE-family HTH domain
MPTTPRTPTVVQILTTRLAACGKTQREIATEIGYDKANIISMFKQGITKVPVNKAPALARALGIDPAYFLRVVMNQYEPEAWAVIDRVTGGCVLSDNERNLLRQYRRAAGGHDRPATVSKAGNQVIVAVQKS